MFLLNTLEKDKQYLMYFSDDEYAKTTRLLGWRQTTTGLPAMLFCERKKYTDEIEQFVKPWHSVTEIRQIEDEQYEIDWPVPQ